MADEAGQGAGQKRAPLCRSADERVIAGVAGGIGQYFGIDPVIVRLAFIVFVVFGGAGLALYLLGWLTLPRAGSGSIIAHAGKQVVGEQGLIAAAARRAPLGPGAAARRLAGQEGAGQGRGVLARRVLGRGVLGCGVLGRCVFRVFRGVVVACASARFALRAGSRRLCGSSRHFLGCAAHGCGNSSP